MPDPVINHSIPLSEKYYKLPYNATRRAKIMLFGSDLIDQSTFIKKTTEEKLHLLEKLERACYNYTIEKAYENNIVASWEIDLFVDLYHSTCAKVSFNICMNGLVNNPNLVTSILDDTINLKELPKMSSQEMFPQKYVDIMKKIEESKTVTTTLKTSALYKCRKCKKNECSMENVYNRSFDEGTNLRITCLNCGYEWGG